MTVERPIQGARIHFNNWEVAAYALFALGGGEKFVHTEDCDALASIIVML